MTENTKIEWADHTFNPWVGCTEISPACDFCYARQWAKRTGHPELWEGERRRTSAANWREPLKWNRAANAFAREHGRRQRVFCASLADVFDNQVPPEWRTDLWALIKDTPDLIWMLLTKRPQNIRGMLPAGRVTLPENVWLGTTVENQEQADKRIPHLLAMQATRRFLSVEPLLGPLDLYHGAPDPRLGGHKATATYIGEWWPAGAPQGAPPTHGVDLVIVGGESGAKARPMHPDWVRSLRDQCQAADVPFFFKQWGEYHPAAEHDPEFYHCQDTPTAIHVSGKVEYRPSEAFRLIGTPDSGYAGMCRIGKMHAGRVLDGKRWSELPRENPF